MASTYNTLRLILGDQLNREHSWFQNKDKDCVYVLMEMHQELEYVTHHIQKIVAFFLGMRELATDLESAGHNVIYYKLDHEHNSGNLIDNLTDIIERYKITKFQYQEPDEYRLDQQLGEFCKSISIETQCFSTEHFYTDRQYLEKHFEGKKTYLMESFYRRVRKENNVLMDAEDPDKPITGKWNYDHENRGSIPKKHQVTPPKLFHKNVHEIVELLQKKKVKTIGRIDSNDFIWPTNLVESRVLLGFFVDECLPHFGKFQDAMVQRAWSLYHARLSFSMNAKIISPREVVNAAISKWEKNRDAISIAQVEGFVRQIIGWREYMRGVYWAQMPNYKEKNFFGHKNPLPSFYWNGETKLSCVSHAVKQSLQFAYAHHIQRLMVTGNFALLMGVDPADVDQWYLGIYIDAIEWVEITNTRGMSQFADGGIVGTKPYISSANYINKMSDYCKDCYYDKSKKYGEKACPFNSLYWNFYEVNRPLLGKNARVSMMYRVWDRYDDIEKDKILSQAQKYIKEFTES